MDAVDFIKERNRMCAYYTGECAGCPAKREDVMCYGDPLAYQTVNIVEIVEKWSSEHPQRTMLQDFLEKYPKIELNAAGVPIRFCPHFLGYSKVVDCSISCQTCWNRPVED